MIVVKRQGEATTQKVISTLIKRVKRYNTVARKRKTANWNGVPSKLKAKLKAIKKANYLANQANKSTLAKKI
jgi:hypothetical protein